MNTDDMDTTGLGFVGLGRAAGRLAEAVGPLPFNVEIRGQDGGTTGVAAGNSVDGAVAYAFRSARRHGPAAIPR